MFTGRYRQVTGSEGVPRAAGDGGAPQFVGRRPPGVDDLAADHDVARARAHRDEVRQALVDLGLRRAVPVDERRGLDQALEPEMAGRIDLGSDLLLEPGNLIGGPDDRRLRIGRADRSESGRSHDPERQGDPLHGCLQDRIMVTSSGAVKRGGGGDPLTSLGLVFRVRCEAISSGFDGTSRTSGVLAGSPVALPRLD
jgi:hypothetical protein